MTANLKQAQDLLFGKEGLGASNFKMFPGDSREATADKIAAEIHDSIMRIADGDFELIGECQKA